MVSAREMVAAAVQLLVLPLSVLPACLPCLVQIPFSLIYIPDTYLLVALLHSLHLTSQLHSQQYFTLQLSAPRPRPLHAFPSTPLACISLSIPLPAYLEEIRVLLTCTVAIHLNHQDVEF
jgi:hypothetical protein